MAPPRKTGTARRGEGSGEDDPEVANATVAKAKNPLPSSADPERTNATVAKAKNPLPDDDPERDNKTNARAPAPPRAAPKRSPPTRGPVMPEQLDDGGGYSTGQNFQAMDEEGMAGEDQASISLEGDGLDARNLQAAGMTDAAIALLDKYEKFFENVKNPTADGKEVTYLSRDDRYYLARGDVLRSADKLDDAMTAYDKAIEAKNVNVTKAYYSKASVFLAKKDYDKAFEMLRDITPEDGTGQLAEAYMAMGEVMFAKKEYGPGCQSYVFGLIKMKAQQAPREQLNAVITDVAAKLKTLKQNDLLKTWNEEAKTFIQ